MTKKKFEVYIWFGGIYSYEMGKNPYLWNGRVRIFPFLHYSLLYDPTHPWHGFEMILEKKTQGDGTGG